MGLLIDNGVGFYRAVYENGSPQNSVSSPGNFNVFKYNTLVEDPQGIYNPSTGIITFPRTAEWIVIASVTFSGTLSVNQYLRVLLDNDQQQIYGNGGNNNYHVRGIAQRKFFAGATLQVGFDASITGNSFNDARSNRLYIAQLSLN